MQNSQHVGHAALTGSRDRGPVRFPFLKEGPISECSKGEIQKTLPAILTESSDSVYTLKLLPWPIAFLADTQHLV